MLGAYLRWRWHPWTTRRRGWCARWMQPQGRGRALEMGDSPRWSVQGVHCMYSTMVEWESSEVRAHRHIYPIVVHFSQCIL